MNIPINQPYVGEIVSGQTFSEQLLKLYFANITGRDDPKKYEWDESNLVSLMESIASGIQKQIKSSENLEIPHVAISFPHVTALYRWGDPRVNELETNMYRVGLADTSGFETIEFPQPELPFNVGCPGELFVIGEENKIRAKSKTMDEYLHNLIPNGAYEGNEVVNPNMVREYLMRK